MKRNSIYESYQQVQLEAIIISILALTLTLGCIIWCYKFYNKNTSVFYVHNRGVTIQVFDNSREKEVDIPAIKKIKK